MEDRLNKLVSVIIVNGGVKDYLSGCLKSVKEQSYACLQTIVIDNSLKPQFSQRMRQDFPWAQFYSEPNNLYYSDSLNKGIKLSQGDFILCLNDDVVLEKNFIQEGLKIFQARDNVGMVSGKILRMDKLTLDSTGLFLSVWRTAKERGYGRFDRGQCEKGGFVFGVSGAAAFYRKDMLENIKEGDNYFDPDFRMFYEDLDVSWRANKCGWKAFYVPSAIAYHVRGGSFRPDAGIGKAIARKYLNDELHCDLVKNRYLTMLKNETFASFILHLIPIAFYDLCAWIFILLLRPKVAKLFFFKASYLFRKKKLLSH
jgi:GT2 family glycosyltransferase